MANPKNPYPKSTKAILNQERSNWDIGDALIEECGPPNETKANNDSHAEIRKFMGYLSETHGIVREFDTLRRARDVSFEFAHGTRVPCVNWTVYRVFQGEPGLLLDWIEDHPSKGMTEKAAKEMLAAYKESLKPVEDDEENEDEDAEATETVEATGAGGDTAETPETAEESSEAAEQDNENQGDEEEPLAAKEEEDAPADTQPETDEDAEVKRDKEKLKLEAEMQQKVREFKALAVEIGRFVEHEDPSLPWIRQANETMKIIAKQVNWFVKEAKRRDGPQKDDKAIKRPQTQDSDSIVIQGRFPPVPNAKGSELVQ